MSKHGNLRSGQKSNLVPCLEMDMPFDFHEVYKKLIDGASMVHFLIPERSIKTFHDCAEKKVIIPFTEKYLATAKHADVIWVQHLFDSLK